MESIEMTTPKSEVPAWANETVDEIDYQLAMFHLGSELEIILPTRREYIALKHHLARMRGLEVPGHEAAANKERAASTEAAEPTNGAAGESISDRKTEKVIRDIVDTLQGIRRLHAGLSEEIAREERMKLHYDMRLLQDIVNDWSGRNYEDDYPNETRMVAAIRGNLSV